MNTSVRRHSSTLSSVAASSCVAGFCGGFSLRISIAPPDRLAFAYGEHGKPRPVRRR